MAKRKARTDAEKEHAKDTRLQRKYGITLARRNELSREQGDKCKVCGGPLDPPCVDHFHFHIEVSRYFDTTLGVFLGWQASAFSELDHVICVRQADTKDRAVSALKVAVMPRMIRGILCRQCNRALGMLERFFDAAHHPENILVAHEYLAARLKNPLTLQ